MCSWDFANINHDKNKRKNKLKHCSSVTEAVTLWLLFMGLPQSRVLLKQKHNSLEVLSEALTQEIRAVARKVFRRSMDNFSQRSQECVDKNGRHLTFVIFST
jgi:hypothetical protein